MSKLFKLKEWLTLNEAANHLSSVFGEQVTIADIYRLALDNHIMLSVNFINLAEAKKVELIKVTDLEYKIVAPKGLKDFPESGFFRVPINAKYPISREYWLKSIEPELLMIKGLWDLPMIGNEKLTVEHLYQQETSGLSIKEEPLKGVFIQRENSYFQLYSSFGNNPEAEAELNDTIDTSSECNSNVHSNFNEPEVKVGLNDTINTASECDSSIHSNLNEPNNSRLKTDHSYPMGMLSKQDAVLVVKMKEVTRFIKSLEDKPIEEKPLHDKERTTLLVLLGSILDKANFDLNERGISGKIKRATESNSTPVSEETIRKLIPQIQSAVELKQNN